MDPFNSDSVKKEREALELLIKLIKTHYGEELTPEVKDAKKVLSHALTELEAERDIDELFGTEWGFLR